MISEEQAQYLLRIRKKIIVDGEQKDSVMLDQSFPMKLKYELVSDEDNEFTFLWQVTQSSRNVVRISLHCQDNDSKIGLFRVDYNAGHINPAVCTADVPERFIPYVGKEFGDTEHHVHYHVPGYRSLAWAVPISDSEMESRELRDGNLFDDLAEAMQEFAKLINLETKILINRVLL